MTSRERNSFANGKQMFTVASCVSCHKLGGIGTEIGQDLTRLDPKLTRADILRSVVEPSHKIDEKYQTWVFALSSGKTITGMILEEKGDTYKVIENPLAKADAVVLKKADVVERSKSPNSIMPKGLLDKLTREEILDRMAYVLAAGDPKHKLFQGGHDHGH